MRFAIVAGIQAENAHVGVSSACINIRRLAIASRGWRWRCGPIVHHTQVACHGTVLRTMGGAPWLLPPRHLSQTAVLERTQAILLLPATTRGTDTPQQAPRRVGIHLLL